MSVNSKMTAIADAIRAKTGGTGTLTLDQMAVEIAGISGGGASLNVAYGAELPAAVVNDQVFIITGTAPTNIYFDTDEPENPVSGDLWVRVGGSDYGLLFSDTFRNGLNKVQQYAAITQIGGTWNSIDGYIGIAGKWERFAVSRPALGTPLSQWTWGQIVDLANSGDDPRIYFEIGDTKDLVLSTGETLTYVIGDFYKNTITGKNTKAAIAFTPHPKCLNTTYTMNDTNTNANGWDGSRMRQQTAPAILNLFPDELTANGAIKYVDVVASASGGTTSLKTSSDRLRLHSVAEIGIQTDNACVEGSVYAYYAAGNRIKTVKGAASNYWTRSAHLSSATLFICIGPNATANNGGAGEDSLGVAFAFDL